MSLKKTFSKDKTKCNVTFTVSAEAAQGAKKSTLQVILTAGAAPTLR